MKPGASSAILKIKNKCPEVLGEYLKKEGDIGSHIYLVGHYAPRAYFYSQN
jgi:hypothetical protein